MPDVLLLRATRCWEGCYEDRWGGYSNQHVWRKVVGKVMWRGDTALVVVGKVVRRVDGKVGPINMF